MVDTYFNPTGQAAPDAGQPAASGSDVETKVDGGVDLAATVVGGFFPQYGQLIKTAEPVSLLAIHAGFVLAHYIQGLLKKK